MKAIKYSEVKKGEEIIIEKSFGGYELTRK